MCTEGQLPTAQAKESRPDLARLLLLQSLRLPSSPSTSSAEPSSAWDTSSSTGSSSLSTSFTSTATSSATSTATSTSEDSLTTLDLKIHSIYFN